MLCTKGARVVMIVCEKQRGLEYAPNVLEAVDELLRLELRYHAFDLRWRCAPHISCIENKQEMKY